MRKQISSGKYRSFMPRPENEQRLALASRLGINISELINDTLAASLEKQLQAKFKKIENEMKMVRGGGFEPPTPTVSKLTPTIPGEDGAAPTLTRYGSAVQSRHRAPLKTPVFTASKAGIVFHATKVPAGGEMSDSANGGPVGSARCESGRIRHSHAGRYNRAALCHQNRRESPGRLY